jgi:hypothetical protein
MRNKAISLVMSIAMLLIMTMQVFAAENEVMPRYNNTGSTEVVFVIDENGLATVSYTCIGYRNITTSIVVTTKIEKKTLWWWSDVDGAEWTDQSNEYYCAHDHSIQLSKSGTYRATITYTVYGSGGEADVITSEIEKKY